MDLKNTVIGLIPLYDDEKDSYWMLPGYMRMLEAEHAIPLMLPLTDDREELDYFLSLCSGFLLTGGHDVSPSVYGEEQKPYCGIACDLRDCMEGYLLKKAVQADKSVFGICRGIQFMNACYGGSLYQDLKIEHASDIEHHMKPPYDRAAHWVTVKKESLLFDILQTEELAVNSYHHQAVRRLSPRFAEMAVSEDGLTEAICMPDKTFVVGVQWHPEFSYETDENSRKIVRAFVESARNRAGGNEIC